jgi:hypothetical protein
LGDDPEDEDEDVVRTVRRIMGPTFGSSKAKGGQNGTARSEEEMLSYPGVAFVVVRSDGGASSLELLPVALSPDFASSTGSTISRVVITPLPAPVDVPVDQAWMHPVLPDDPSVAEGDLRLAEIQVRLTIPREVRLPPPQVSQY